MVVGICVQRSLEMVVGLLGILKADRAYVPLDPAFPKQRQAAMLEDDQVPVLVIYTSGSTGTPKKVAIEHRQLLNYLHSIQQTLNVPNTSFATVSTFAADLGNTVIFPALCGGGCLHLISQDRATDPKALGEYIHQQAIDCLKIVPSHLKAFLAQTASILPRKLLILGGEGLSWKLVEKVWEYAPDCLIVKYLALTFGQRVGFVYHLPVLCWVSHYRDSSQKTIRV